MTENTVLWTPRSNQEKTACSKWKFMANKWRPDLGPRSTEGHHVYLHLAS